MYAIFRSNLGGCIFLVQCPQALARRKRIVFGIVGAPRHLQTKQEIGRYPLDY